MHARIKTCIFFFFPGDRNDAVNFSSDFSTDAAWWISMMCPWGHYIVLKKRLGEWVKIVYRRRMLCINLSGDSENILS